MNSFPPLIQTLRWLRGKRLRKKVKLYKEIFEWVMDITIAIYLIAFLFICLLAFKNWITEFNPATYVTMFLKEEWLFTIFTALLIRAFVSSTRNPGVYITSAEYQLSLLPFSRKHIWLFCLTERFIKITIKCLLVFLLLLSVIPGQLAFLIQLILSVWLANITGVVIQWKLFQIKGLKKFLLILCGVILLISVRQIIVWGYIPASSTLYVTFFCLFLLSLFLLIRAPLQGVDWTTVVSFGDVKVWNMFLVQQFTKVAIKPPRKFQLFQKLLQGPRARRPFPYHLAVISRRLWRPFLRDNLNVILQTIGAILVLIVGLGFQGEILLGLALAIGVFVLNQIVGALFTFQFNQPIMYALPWDFNAWFESFKKWYLPIFIIFWISSIAMMYIHNLSVLIIIASVLFYSFWLKVDLELSIEMKLNYLIKQEWRNGSKFVIRIIGFLLTTASVFNWWISIIGIALLACYKMRNKGLTIKVNE
jgi:hypothetical protein